MISPVLQIKHLNCRTNIFKVIYSTDIFTYILFSQNSLNRISTSLLRFISEVQNEGSSQYSQNSAPYSGQNTVFRDLKDTSTL